MIVSVFKYNIPIYPSENSVVNFTISKLYFSIWHSKNRTPDVRFLKFLACGTEKGTPAAEFQPYNRGFAA